jgi:hypothetical protein
MDNCSTESTMPTEIVRHQTPEEAELLRKREELASVRAALAERELELADLRAQLRSFEGRYLRQVGVLYAELDEWASRIAELEASLDTTPATQQRAAEARQRADESHEATHGEASKADDFQPSADLKSLFRDIAKRIHPDFAKDAADQQRRTRLMAQANEAYGRGDVEELQRILNEFKNDPESIQGEGIGAELIRIIRQIAQAKTHIVAIEKEIALLHDSEIAKLRHDVETAAQLGRDLLAELAATISEQVAQSKKHYEDTSREARTSGR